MEIGELSIPAEFIPTLNIAFGVLIGLITWDVIKFLLSMMFRPFQVRGGNAVCRNGHAEGMNPSMTNGKDAHQNEVNGGSAAIT